jgi:hypothetical protein
MRFDVLSFNRSVLATVRFRICARISDGAMSYAQEYALLVGGGGADRHVHGPPIE